MKRPSGSAITAVVMAAALAVYACSLDTAGTTNNRIGEGAVLPDGTVFTRADLLTAFGTCILSEIEAFEAQSRAFSQAANSAITDDGQTAVSSDDVQTAWQNTIDIWQRLEMMQVGPAGRKTRPGGKDLRTAIYPWPHRDHCEIDKNITAELYATNAADVSPEASGLWAAEYLLFASSSMNTCGPDDGINTDGSWAAIEPDTLARRRAAYAAFAASSVAGTAQQLLNAWSPSADNFLAELTQAGEGSRTYGKKRVAINAVSDALFYIEWNTKDNKLARPLGLIGCDDDVCTELVESRYGRRSKEHLRNNLVGFRKIFTGCGVDNGGLGFDDYLHAVEQPELAQEIDQAALAAMDAIDAIDEEDLVTALEDDPQSVLDVHSAMRQLTDLLRSDFLTVLRLELPQMVQGDND